MKATPIVRASGLLTRSSARGQWQRLFLMPNRILAEMQRESVGAKSKLRTGCEYKLPTPIRPIKMHQLGHNQFALYIEYPIAICINLKAVIVPINRELQSSNAMKCEIGGRDHPFATVVRTNPFRNIVNVENQIRLILVEVGSDLYAAQ